MEKRDQIHKHGDLADWLVIEVPYGKWSHLLYRPLALYLSAVQARARQPQASHVQAAPAVPA